MKKTRHLLAVDAGSQSLKMSVLEIAGNRVAILKTALIEIPQQENLDRKEFIKSSIQEFLVKNIPVKYAYIALSFPYVEIVRVILPFMPLQEVPNAVKLKIKDQISFAAEDAMIDSVVTDEFVNEDGSKNFIVMASAAKKSEIDMYISISQQLNLSLIGINAVLFGFSNILQYAEEVKNISVIEIGAKYTSLCIYKSGRLVFIRKLPVSSSQITESMCGVLISDKGRVELNYEEAERIKRQYGFPVDEKDFLDGRIPANQVIALTRPLLEHLAVETSRTFGYYSSELKGVLPEAIYLAGGGARLKNLDKFLYEKLNIPVNYLSLPAGVENRTQEDSRSMLSFLGVIGSALPLAGETINLLPEEVASEKVEAYKKASIRIAGFTALSIFAVLFISINMHISSYKKQLESAKSYRMMIQKVMDMHNEVIEYTEAVAAIRKGAIPIDVSLKEISNIIPSNIVLSELNINMDARDASFKGIIYPKGDMAETELTKFMEALEKTVYFKEANLVSVRKAEAVTVVASDFEIKCLIE